MKGLEDVEVSECESCTFEVTLNLAYIEGVWTRDGMQLKSKPNCRISMNGKKHSLTLNRVALGDAGLFCFQANGIQTSGQLSVKGKTANENKLPPRPQHLIYVHKCKILHTSDKNLTKSEIVK